jgi:hypothetical protein
VVGVGVAGGMVRHSLDGNGRTLENEKAATPAQPQNR